jgi:plasmid maintenance system antidote protein VapI
MSRGWSTKPRGAYVVLRVGEIDRYMRRRDWTNADLARAIGKSRSYVHRLLTGQAPCDEAKADAIAHAFNVTREAIADELSAGVAV